MGTVVVPSTSQEIGNESCTTFSSNATTAADTNATAASEEEAVGGAQVAE
jgi:hypothetical protein